mmetsp:Transcript_11353/g.19871  ORF Transcript_11353/g.19871 Transcript_11353/m.19871 type:complete len:508 (-) Transcript_11353:275-1798(-)|eukprot:CAMPEP_0119110698 /NCGR_PEP_ID=MMETSP1180-20130426/31542_1 /TAXON_ID=3052 ORGANISM="Chlamydomonas cf sp, Strain CCMP681" /NCGR_SAMPLE_ID=MMETSP1180 /ASSEMBLY_ACC=CAM_ASM_000741 /LENGTH=507 /DNA_ID=CAMNT_0007097209 /DNA_START=68 /DNA_END=1591 /DNA_ORIENTATION=+
MTVLDVESIQKELVELNKERAESKQRLDQFRPMGGRGMGRGPGRFEQGPGYGRGRDDSHGRDGPGGVFGRLAGGGLRGPGASGPRQGNFQSEREHPLDDRAPGSGRSAFHRSDHDDRDGGRSFRARGEDFPMSREPYRASLPEATAPRKRSIASAVVVAEGEPGSTADEQDGAVANDRYDPEAEEGEAVSEAVAPSASGRQANQKRPAEESAPDAGIRKRNRRMFGALLGTLQKFKDENAQFQSSDVAAKRADALRKADERERTESERLRRREAEARAARRIEELEKLSGLSLATDTKMLELLYASRMGHKQALGKFLCTKQHPPLHWLPGVSSKHTDALFEQQTEELEQWKAAMLEELEREKEGLLQRSQSRRDAALERRSAREERMAAARAAGVSGPQAARAEAEAAAADRAADDEEKLIEKGEYAVLESHANDMEVEVEPEVAAAGEPEVQDEDGEAQPDQQDQQGDGTGYGTAGLADMEDVEATVKTAKERDGVAETVEDLLS